MAHQLNPQATRVLAVVDDTVSGMGCTRQFRAVQSDFPDLEFNTLDTSRTSRDEIAQKLAACDSKTIILYMIMSNDGDGNLYSIEEALGLASQSASQPLYKSDDIGIGLGALGGRVVSYESTGKAVAKRTQQVLEGASPSSIPVSASDVISKFDYNVMTRFNIAENALPADSQIINKPKSVFENMAVKR